MSTRYDLADPESREAGLSAAVTAVRRGQLVVLPTDTVYGLGVDAFDAEAVQRLLDAKGRGRDMPPPVLISATTTLEALASGLPDVGRRTRRALLARSAHHRLPPAALAAVGPRRDARHGRGPDAARPGRARPARPDRSARGVLGEPQRPAGRHRRREAEEMLGEAVEVVLDGGPSAGGESSTIVDCTGDRPRVLRGGRDRPVGAGLVLAGPRDRARRGGRAACVSTSSSSWSPAPSATCCASSPASWRSGPGPSRGCATATSTPTPIPYFGGVAMLGGLGAGLLVARHLPFLSTSQDFVFHDSGVVLVAGAMICALGVRRRPDRARRADQARRPGPGGGVHGAQRRAALVASSSPASASSCSTRPRPCCSPMLLVVGTVNAVNFVDGLDGLAGGDRADRRDRLLPLLLQAGRRQRRDPGDHARRCCARRWAGPAPASCRTTSSRRGSSWATPARCCSGWCSPGRR